MLLFYYINLVKLEMFWLSKKLEWLVIWDGRSTSGIGTYADVIQVGDEHEGKHKDRTLGGFFSALRGRSHWDTVEDLKCTWPRSMLEGLELQPAPVPRMSAPVHRNTDLLQLQLTEVAIFSCSHRFPPICLLLFLSSITQCNIERKLGNCTSSSVWFL
jgi:hypothetical protein